MQFKQVNTGIMNNLFRRISTFSVIISVSVLLGLCLGLSGCDKEDAIELPVIESFLPAAGIEGMTVTVIGKHFGTSPFVSLNGLPVTVTAFAETSLTFTVPAGASSGVIQVTNNKGGQGVSSTHFKVLHPPVITSFSPNHGGIGTEIKITATNSATNPVVKIGGQPVKVNSSSSDAIYVRVSVGATTGKITVETADGTAESGSEFTVDAHTITRVMTATWPIEEVTVAGPGSLLVIEGSNFSNVPAENMVKLNNTALTPSEFSTTSQLRVEIPAGATSGKIAVTIGSKTVESASITVPPGKWIKKNNFPGTGRYATAAFSIADKAYMGTGENSPTAFNDFWEYNAASDTWTQKADFIGTKLVNGRSFVINNKGYLCLGYGGSSASTDLWEYDPAANTWTKKASIPIPYLNTSVAFNIGNKGYVTFGYNGTLYEYSDNDQWTKKQDFPLGSRRDDAIAIAVGNKAYAGLGIYYSDGNTTSEYLKDFWEYDQSANSWTRKADFPGPARSKAVAYSLNGKVYVGGGGNGSSNENAKNDFWMYDPQTNTWSPSVPAFFGDTRSATGFVVSGKGYLSYQNKGLWEFNPQ
jgi:N-acetylneuraminic acid mutarotase